MKRIIKKVKDRANRRRRIRAVVKGTTERPRLSFFKSNKNVYAQIIDDTVGKTIVGVSSLKLDKKEGGATKCAETLGTEIAEKAIKLGVKKVVFDRGGFMYTGVVKVFADNARKGGLEF